MNTKTVIIALALVIGAAAAFVFLDSSALKEEPFYTLGFNLDEYEAAEPAMEALEQSKRMVTSDGSEYYRKEFGDGIELMGFYTDEYIYLSSFYQGENTTRVKIVNVDEVDIIEGLITVQALTPEGVERGIPFEAWLPDIYRHQLQLPQIADLNFMVEAWEFGLYEDAQTFAESIGKPEGVTVEPTFTSGKYQSTSYKPMVTVTGVVRDAKELTNPITGRNFYWLLVETYLFTFDVIVENGLLDSTPENGNWVFVGGAIVADWPEHAEE